MQFLTVSINGQKPDVGKSVIAPLTRQLTAFCSVCGQASGGNRSKKCGGSTQKAMASLQVSEAIAFTFCAATVNGRVYFPAKPPLR
jgi:hypothetical protein